MKFIKYKGNDSLAELFQSVDLKLTFVHQTPKTFRQLHKPVKCRDFLGDCIWSKMTGNPVSIYGFKYKYKDAPFDSDALKLSLTFPDEQTLENFRNNFYTIQNYDVVANVTKSEYITTSDPNTLIVIADKEWQSHPWKISLYTFFIKKACYNGKLQSPESTYNIKLTHAVLNKFLSKVKEIFIHAHEDIYSAHNYSGFYSILTNSYAKELKQQIFGE